MSVQLISDENPRNQWALSMDSYLAIGKKPNTCLHYKFTLTGVRTMSLKIMSLSFALRIIFIKNLIKFVIHYTKEKTELCSSSVFDFEPKTPNH